MDHRRKLAAEGRAATIALKHPIPSSAFNSPNASLRSDASAHGVLNLLQLTSVSSHSPSSSAVILTAAPNSSAIRFDLNPRRDNGRCSSAAGDASAAFVSTAEQRDQLPQGGRADEGVDDAAQQAHFADERRDEVEAEQADEAPVEHRAP